MRSFLYHILNGLIVDEYRKRKTISLETLLEKGFEPTTACKELGDIIDSQSTFLLIRCLPKTYRKIIHMRYINGYSIAEISLLTNQSKNNISVKLHRGHKILKSLM